MKIRKFVLHQPDRLVSLYSPRHSLFTTVYRRLSAGETKSCLLIMILFLFALVLPLHAATPPDIIIDYEGEHVELDFDVSNPSIPSQFYDITSSLSSLGCTKRDGELGIEMECAYAADAPYYGNIYDITTKFTPASGSGTSHSMWTTVQAYPGHTEYDYIVHPQDFIGTGSSGLTHTASSIFVPMWPDDVNTAYAIVIRYTADRPGGYVGFNVKLIFWGFDPTAVTNTSWLKGLDGETRFLKFCGGQIKPDKKGGGPGL